MTDLVRLASGEARLAISAKGAEAREWVVAGRDLLWPSDPASWNQISPILFPVVGWTRDGARVNGQYYPLRLHGFAASQSFALHSQTNDTARFLLTDNDETRAVYPFAFRLHPAFRWPFDGAGKTNCRVVFDKPERGDVPVMVPGGLISSRRRPI